MRVILKKKLVLASSSQRRSALLKQIGLEFEVAESRVPEEFDPQKNVEENVQDVALRKAVAVATSFDDAIIVGADTVVVLGEDILVKPTGHRDAVEMLKRLSGRVHEVYTGFSLVDRPTNASISAVEITKVKFRELPLEEISEYVLSGSPLDKAGAYGIQDDYGAVFVERIDGCFYNVVGFPLAKFYVTLQEFQKQLGLI